MKSCIIILFLLISFSGNAQQNKGFDCFTDRDVYVSGETLLAKIFTPENSPSGIVHLDLINRQGTHITGAPMEIRNNQADGFLHLPDSLSTGIYLLRAYQKNPASGLKIVHELWISNRFNGLEKTEKMDRVIPSGEIQERNSEFVHIQGLREKYAANSPVSASVHIDEQLQKKIDGKLLVSMAQTYPSFQSATFRWNGAPAPGDLIENKGVVLSGVVTDRNTQKPVSGVTVFLTIPDSIPGFQYYKTQSDGRFYFLLDKYHGTVEAFVQCFRIDPAQPLKILLEDHSSKASDLPPFRQQNISEEFRNSVTTGVDAMTFRKIFGDDKEVVQGKSRWKLDAYPYYGMPTSTVDPQLFIDLPNFNEISKELLHGVKFRNYNNEPTIQVMYPAMRAYFTDPPLILIDGIPIRDLNIIKNMGSKDIDRVDICQSERFYGDLKFEGVVAIYTTSHDYSRIPESSELIRLNLETIQVPSTLAQPESSAPNIPDLRQVFYWNPAFDPAKPLTINTKSSSITGHFKLVVRGRLKDGSFIYSEKQFEVN